MIRNYFKSKYFKRILQLILLAGIIPVLILGSFTLKLTSIYSDDYHKMHKSIVANQKNRVEDTLKSTEYSMIQFLHLPEVAEIIRTPRHASYFQEFNLISSKLYQLQSPRLNIDDTILVSFEKDWVLSKYEFTDIASSGYCKLINSFSQNTNTSFWYNDDEYVYIIKKLPLNSINANGLLFLRIRNTAIEEIAVDHNDYFPVTIISKDGNGIIGRKENLEVAVYSKSLSEFNEEILSGDIVDIPYKGRNYTLTSSISDYNDWIYLSIVLTSQLNESINLLYLINAVIIFFIVICIVFFSLNFSRKLYQPIENFNQAMDNEILSSGASTELCIEENPYNKLKYILLSITELRKDLYTHKKNEINDFLSRVYSNNYTELKEEDFIERGLTNAKLNECHMYVIGIKYSDNFENKADSDLYLFALQNIIEEIFSNEEFLQPININDIIYVTYIKKVPSEIGIHIYLKNLFESLSLIVEKYLHKRIYIGISKCFFNVKGFSNAIEECNMALRICVQRFKGMEFFSEEENSSFLYPDTKLNLRRMKIIQSVTNGDNKTGKSELDEYFIELRQINFYLFKLEINNLLSDILTCIQSSSITIDYSIIGKITNFDITSSLNSIEELKKCLWDNLLVPLYRKAVEPPETETADTLQQIIEYLNENIENNISLDQCAGHFNYNPNYLSRMFKNHFGKTFTDYVIEQKIKMGKQFLLTTDLSINEIAMRLGYNNSQNFIRVFKKNVLMTPGQFRSKHQKNENSTSLVEKI